MIILKQGIESRRERNMRRKAYNENPAYLKRCKICGTKVLFRQNEIIRSSRLHEPDAVRCVVCQNDIDVRLFFDEGKIPYWRWRLFYAKKYE